MWIPSIDAVQRAVGDHYTIEGLLGQGGMGAVFRGRHRSLDSPVAVKVLPVPASLGSAGLERFRREAMIASHLPHPNIVPVYEFDIRDDVAFLIMPLVEGVSLDRRIAQEGRLSWRDARRLLEQVGGALEFAHERGVVHRDIKPANILWEPSTGRWLVTDFGIARRMQEDGAALTVSGMIVGTPAYMAPEQASGTDVDRRADVYGLGAVAFEALSGARPEPMTDASRAARDLKKARPEFSPRQVDALSAALALDRDERPATVREWLDRLDRAGSHRGARTVLALVTVAAAALAVTVWQRYAAPRGSGQLTAVLPLAVVPGGGLDTSLGRSLADAFVAQLRFLDPRVAAVSEVEKALRTARFGSGPVDPDAAASVAASTLGAARILTGKVGAAGEDRVYVAVRLQTGAGTPVSSDSAAAHADSVYALVRELVVSQFAQGLVEQQVGWPAVLPPDWNAMLSLFAARRLLRAGAYSDAVDLYDAVIAADSTFAPAYFERTLAEVLRAQPTRASQAVRAALDATSRYRDQLDPATRELLAAYQTLVAEGDPDAAHEQLTELVRRHERGPDAWFILGYLELHFGPLFGVEPSVARLAFERAAALDPAFAAPHALLAWIAFAEKDPAARDHLRDYLAIDSTSESAQLVRLVYPIRFGTPKERTQAVASLEDLPSSALELIAMVGATLSLSPAERTVAADAIQALRARARTGTDRAIAFRLEMASLLGAARLQSAERLLDDGPLRKVPAGELDAWTVLLAVTGATRSAPDSTATDDAARRLADLVPDPTAQWLVARWWQGRDARAVAGARGALGMLAGSEDGAAILARSLLLDLHARDSLAAGDITGAMDCWARATQHYQIEEVPFGLVASLWPLEVERARLIAARGDHDAVLLIAQRFRHAVGFMDQIARLDVLPLGIVAHVARKDAFSARQLADSVLRLWNEPDGAGTTLRDSIRIHVPGM